MSKIKAVLNSSNFNDVNSFGLLNREKIFGAEKTFGHQVFSTEKTLKSGDKIEVISMIDPRANEYIINSNKIIGNCNLSLFIDDIEVASLTELNKETYPWTFHITYTCE